MSDNFENYKFVMLSSDGGSNKHRSRERDHGRSSRAQNSPAKYSHSSDKYRPRSPPRGMPHVYRGGVRQYPKTVPQFSSSYSSRRGGGPPPPRRFAPRGGFVSRSSFRGGPPLSSRGGPSRDGYVSYSLRGPTLRGRGTFRGNAPRGTLHTTRRSVSPVRKTRHPLPYALSPVRHDAEPQADEVLTKSELITRMREAKESDNFDELYRLRELYRKLMDSGGRALKVKASLKSRSLRSEDAEPSEWDLEEVECIEETFDDEEDEVEDITEKCDSTSRSNEQCTIKESVERTSSASSKPRKHSRRSSSHSENGDRLNKRKSEPKRSENRSDEEPRQQSARGGDVANCSTVISDCQQRPAKRRRRERGEDSFGEEDEDEVEDEAAYLQFAEDSVDVETMVKASEQRSTNGRNNENLLAVENDDLLDVLMNEDVGEYELDYDEGDVAMPSLKSLLVTEFQQRVMSMSADEQSRLHRKLMAKHHQRLQQHDEVDDAERTALSRFAPALTRSLILQLPSFLSQFSQVSSLSRSLSSMSKADVDEKVQKILSDFFSSKFTETSHEELVLESDSVSEPQVAKMIRVILQNIASISVDNGSSTIKTTGHNNIETDEA